MVKRHRHYEFLKQFAPDELKRIKPEVIAETEAEYGRLQKEFATKKWLKRDWCKANLREMAEDVGLEAAYAVIYPVASSIHHLDIVGLAAQSAGEDVEILPSTQNLELSLAVAGIGLFTVLDCYSEVASLGFGEELQAMSKAYKSALDECKKTE